MNNLLPDTPSDLIRLAVDDLKRAVASGYDVQMYEWHQPGSNYRGAKHCAVCFAGAVMACTLDTPATELKYPQDFDPDTKDKLRALDLFRNGKIERGLDYMGLQKPKWLSYSVDMPTWEFDGPVVFYAAMEELITHLKAEGL